METGDNRFRQIYIFPLIGLMLLAYFLVTLKTAITQSPDIPAPLDALPPQTLYWMGLILIASPFIFPETDRRVKILSILIFASFILLSYPLFALYDFPYGRDSIYAYQLCEDIYEKGYYGGAEMGTGQAIIYNHYPAMYIFVVTASRALGTPLITTFIWITGLLRLLTIPALIYLIFRKIFNEENALFCVFLYLTCPSLINFPHHGGFALIFLLSSLYLLIKLRDNATVSFVVANMFLALMLVISHHLSAYIWMMWITVLFISFRILNSDAIKGYRIKTSGYVYISSTYILLFLVLFLSWSVYNAYLDIIHLMISAKNALISILSPMKHELAPSSLGVSFHPYERILVYSSMIIMASYIIYGTWITWRIIRGRITHQKMPSTLIVNFLYCSFLVLVASLTWSTSNFFILLRIFKFAYIGLIPIAILGINSLYKKGHVFKAIVPFTLIILLMGGNLMLDGSNQRFYYIDRSKLSNENYLFLTPEVYAAGKWLKDNHTEGDVLGDSFIYDTLGGFGHTNVKSLWDALRVETFGSDNISTATIEKLNETNIRYVATNRYMTKYPCLSISDRIYTEKQINKFINHSNFHTIYKNEVITIYEVKQAPKKEAVETRFTGGRILVLTKGSERDGWKYKMFWGSKPLKNFRYDLVDVEKEDLPDELEGYSLIILDSTLDDASLLNTTEKEALWNAIRKGSNAFFIYFSTLNFWEPEFNATGSWNLSHEIRFNSNQEIFPTSLVGDIDHIYSSGAENISPGNQQFYFRRYNRSESFKPLISTRTVGTDVWSPWLIYAEYGRGKIIAHAGRGDEITGFMDQYHINVGRLNPRVLYYLCEGCVQKTFGESLDVGIRVDDTGALWLIDNSTEEYHIRLLNEIKEIFPRSTHQVYIRPDSVFWNSTLKELLIKDIAGKKIQTCLHDYGGRLDGYGPHFSYESIYNQINTTYVNYEEFFGYKPYCWTTPQHSVNDNVTKAIEEMGILVDLENRSEVFASDTDYELTWGRRCGPKGVLIDGSGFTKGPAAHLDDVSLRIDKLERYNEYISMGYPYYFYDHHYSFLQNTDNYNKTMNLLNELDAGGLLEIHPQFLPAYAYKYLNVQNLSIDKQENYGNGTIRIKLSNRLPVRGAGIRVIGRMIDSAYLDGRKIYFIRNNIDGTVVLSEKLDTGEHELILKTGEGTREPRITWSDGRIEDVSFDGHKLRFTSVSMPMMWTDVKLRSGEKEITFTYITSKESVKVAFDTDLNPGGIFLDGTWKIKEGE